MTRKPLRKNPPRSGDDRHSSRVSQTRTKQTVGDKPLESMTILEIMVGSAKYGRLKRIWDQKAAAMISRFPDDVLREIFARLPHARSAIWCGIVCKRWRKVISSPEFAGDLNRLNHHRCCHYSDPSYSRPYTLLLKLSLFSSDSSTLIEMRDRPVIHRYLATDHDVTTLSPWQFPPFSSVRTSSNQLLLWVGNVSGHIVTYNTFLCVYDTLIPLPFIIPRFSWISGEAQRTYLGLSCHPDGGNGYRIASVSASWRYYVRDHILMTSVFSSDTGLWTKQNYPVPSFVSRHCSEITSDAVSCGDGILYFSVSDHITNLAGFFAIDPFDRQPLRFLPIPTGFGLARKSRVRVGAVGGRLRISNERDRNVKIWELGCDRDGGSPSWGLVHDVVVAAKKKERVFILGFHPNNGDVIFVARDSTIFRYDIGREKYDQLGPIPDYDELPKNLKNNLPLYFDIFTLFHSSSSRPQPPPL